MTGEDSIESGRAAIVGELVKEVAESPKVREAGGQIAQAALTVSKTLNVCLLPLAALNFGYEKARTYFSETFATEIEHKASSIPQENIVEPKASIAGPALQGLAFSHEEPNLKEMYLSLIATAMDGRIADSAHPSFVEIIRQLNAEEARLLRPLLARDRNHPIAEIRLILPGKKSYEIVQKHLMNMTYSISNEPAEREDLPALVDNWIRLGLVQVSYNLQMANEESYNWVEKRPEVQRLRSQCESDGKTIECVRGILTRTALGGHFAKSVGLHEE